MTVLHTSTFPIVKSTLITQIAALPDLAAATVSYGRPRDFGREVVVLAGTSSDGQQWRTLGARTREENYAIQTIINVDAPGNTQQAATERAFAILADIETLLRGEPMLGLVPDPVSYLLVAIDPKRLIEVASAEGYEAEIQAEILVQSRI